MTVLVLATTATRAGIIAPDLLCGIAAHRAGRQGLATRGRKKGKDILHAIEHVVNDRGAFIVSDRRPVFIQTKIRFLWGLGGCCTRR